MAEQKFVTVVKAETVFKRALITQEHFNRLKKCDFFGQVEEWCEAYDEIQYEDWVCDSWEDNEIINHEVIQYVAFKGDVMWCASEEVYNAGLDCWEDAFPIKTLTPLVSQ